MTDEFSALLANTPYRVTGSLGRGGLGEVLRVEHSFLGREFALKVLHARYSADAGVIDRMRLEAQATARLQHPNIVDVSDFWITDDGRACILMELLQGDTVAHNVMVRGAMSLQAAVEFTWQLLAALKAAHALGVVHRDIKPENLFLHALPTGVRILKVLDFGLARVLPGAPGHAPARPVETTATGVVMGTPRFSSPEGLRGERVDARADLFSAGLVFYFMLTRRGAYDNMRTTDVPEGFQITPPSHCVGHPMPHEIDSIVRKAVRWSVDDRYQTAAEFATDLQRVRERLSNDESMSPTEVRHATTSS